MKSHNIMKNSQSIIALCLWHCLFGIVRFTCGSVRAGVPVVSFTGWTNAPALVINVKVQNLNQMPQKQPQSAFSFIHLMPSNTVFCPFNVADFLQKLDSGSGRKGTQHPCAPVSTGKHWCPFLFIVQSMARLINCNWRQSRQKKNWMIHVPIGSQRFSLCADVQQPLCSYPSAHFSDSTERHSLMIKDIL